MKFELFHLWLWFWFGVGATVYWLKRAYYLITGPNPIANSWGDFIHRCWVPLLVRFVVDSGIYWLTFYPDLLSQGLKLVGVDTEFHSPIPQYAVVALFFGLSIDSIVDFGVTKIPYIKGWLPQMPAPLPAVDPVPPPEIGGN